VALNPKFGNAAANAAADAISDALDNGYLRIYTGSQPAGADTALSGQTLLAELRYANPASGAASGGVVTFSAMTADSSADATGTAAWFRALKSDGTTAVFDGSVGTSGCDLNLNSTAIQSGAAVSISSHTYTFNKG